MHAQVPCLPTPVRTRSSSKAAMRIVGFDTSPTSVTEAAWRDEAIATPRTAESCLRRELSRDRPGPRLSVLVPGRADRGAMKKSQSSVELSRAQHSFEPYTVPAPAASLSGSPPGSQPSSCGSHPIRIPSSPHDLRRRISLRSLYSDSLTEQTVPSGGGPPRYLHRDDPEGLDCPPTCAAAVPLHLGPSTASLTCAPSQLPLIEEFAGSPLDPEPGDLDLAPTLAASRPLWPAALRR